MARRLVHCDSAPFVPRRLMPLPSLYNGPTHVHSLLSYQYPSPAITYDISLSPTTAKLSLSANQNVFQDWKDYPAIDPPEITSLTIRLDGLSRPIVVFPHTLDAQYINIGDVLSAVHSKVKAECVADANAMEIYSSFQDKNILRCAIYRLLGGKCIWGGLYPDNREPDMWVLRKRISNKIY